MSECEKIALEKKLNRDKLELNQKWLLLKKKIEFAQEKKKFEKKQLFEKQSLELQHNHDIMASVLHNKQDTELEQLKASQARKRYLAYKK